VKKIIVIGLICFLLVSLCFNLFYSPILCGGTISQMMNAFGSCTEMELEFMGLIYKHKQTGTIIYFADNDKNGAIILGFGLTIAATVFFILRLTLKRFGLRREK
jgi:hypothetical protein